MPEGQGAQPTLDGPLSDKIVKDVIDLLTASGQLSPTKDNVAEALKEASALVDKNWDEVARKFIPGQTVRRMEKGVLTAEMRLSRDPEGASWGRPRGLESPTKKWNEVGALPDPAVPPEVAELAANESNVAMAYIELPFYVAGTRLWHFWFPNDRADAFAIQPPSGPPIPLNWTNEPIYKLNDRLFRYAKDLRAYARCFFHLVRGKMGQFAILEDPRSDLDLLPWADPKNHEHEEEIRKRVAPLERRAINAEGETVFRGWVLFRDGLFTTDIAIHPSGQLRLENEQLEFEGLPVIMRISAEAAPSGGT